MPHDDAREDVGVKNRWWAIGLLSLLYVLSFADRVILALLIAPLKHDLGLSDLQLALLFGPAFAIFYALMALPAARFADSANRRNLVVAGVTLWGLATIGSGFAGSYAILLTLRCGLAIGEAALTPAAHSMIGDLFPTRQRTLAASIYSAVGMAGGSGAYILGAMVIQMVDNAAAAGATPPLAVWQLVLILLGVPTVIVGFVFALTVREPARIAGGHITPNLREIGSYLKQEGRLYGGLFLGAGLITAIIYAYSAWGVELLRRQYGWPVTKAGTAFGLAGLAASFTGTVAAPFVVRMLERRGRRDALALTSIGALAAGAALAAFAPLQTNPIAYLSLFGLASFFLNGAANNVLVGLQVLAPARMRATLVALLLMCVTFLGLVTGPTLSALLSAELSADGQALGLALAILTPLIATPALSLLFWSRGAFVRQPAPISE